MLCKLCNKCYGKNLNKDCNDDHITWMEYVEKFIEDFPDYPMECYGNLYVKTVGRYNLCKM